MAVVDRCSCLDIETGGRIVAWSRMFIYGLALVALLFTLLSIFIFQSSVPDEMIVTKGCEKSKIKYSGKTSSVLLILIATGLTACLFYISFVLNQGIYNRDPSQVFPAVVLTSTELLCSIYAEMVSTSVTGAVIDGLLIAFAVYSVIVVSLLFIKIKLERGSVKCDV